MEMPGTPEYAAMLKECIRLKLEGRFDDAHALEREMNGFELVLDQEQVAALRARTPDVVVEELDINLPGWGFMAKEEAAALAEQLAHAKEIALAQGMDVAPLPPSLPYLGLMTKQDAETGAPQPNRATDEPAEKIAPRPAK